MSSSQVIANYESLSALTGQMLQAAKDEQWDQLVELENQSSNLIAAMKRLDAEVALDAVAELRKKQLIQKILADHAEISTLTLAWISELGQITQSLHHEKRLQKAYGS